MEPPDQPDQSSPSTHAPTATIGSGRSIDRPAIIANIEHDLDLHANETNRSSTSALILSIPSIWAPGEVTDRIEAMVSRAQEKSQNPRQTLSHIMQDSSLICDENLRDLSIVVASIMRTFHPEVSRELQTSTEDGTVSAGVNILEEMQTTKTFGDIERAITGIRTMSAISEVLESVHRRMHFKEGTVNLFYPPAIIAELPAEFHVVHFPFDAIPLAIAGHRFIREHSHVPLGQVVEGSHAHTGIAAAGGMLASAFWGVPVGLFISALGGAVSAVTSQYHANQPMLRRVLMEEIERSELPVPNSTPEAEEAVLAFLRSNGAICLVCHNRVLGYGKLVEVQT